MRHHERQRERQDVEAELQHTVQIARGAQIGHSDRRTLVVEELQQKLHRPGFGDDLRLIRRSATTLLRRSTSSSSGCFRSIRRFLLYSKAPWRMRVAFIRCDSSFSSFRITRQASSK